MNISYQHKDKDNLDPKQHIKILVIQYTAY